MFPFFFSKCTPVKQSDTYSSPHIPNWNKIRKQNEWHSKKQTLTTKTHRHTHAYIHMQTRGKKNFFFLAWGIRLQSPALESQVLNQSSRTVNIQAIFISNQLMQFIFVIFMQNAKCFVKCTFISTFFIFYLCFLRDSFCSGNELCALDSLS